MKMPENPEQDPADCMGKEPGRTGIFPAAKSFREKFPAAGRLRRCQSPWFPCRQAAEEKQHKSRFA